MHESIQHFNTYYTDRKTLQEFISDHDIDNSPSLLIQIFSAITDQVYISTLLSELTGLLPDAVIIGTTTDGEIMNGKISTGKVVLSFTRFSHTSLKYAAVTHYGNDSFESGRHLAQLLIDEDTKLLISFADGLLTNGEEYLDGIASVNDEVIVAGGLAGDNFQFQNTLVFSKDGVLKEGAVAVALSSNDLHIHTDYSFNWQPVGNEMTVTKADKNRLYTLNDQKVVDIYSYYLGIQPEQFMTGTGINFPLIVKHQDMNIARSIISKKDDGSVIMAGNLTVGDKVRIGFGDVKGIITQSQKIIEQTSQMPSEAIFIYSCTARRYFMGDKIENEILPFQSISPVSGFFTYGEFFTSQKNELLNQTMTILSLSESGKVKHLDQKPMIKSEKVRSDYFSALVHLINTTSRELQANTDELHRQARYDTLTGLPNRALFMDRLEQSLIKAKRNGNKVALFFIDLDKFKHINDSFGHQVGDKVLQSVAEHLGTLIRKGDTFARLSGDEFTMIIEEVNDGEDLVALAQKLLAHMKEPIYVDEYQLYLSLSIGISIYPDDTDQAVELLKYADTAMYKAKESGRNTFEFYASEMTSHALERMMLKTSLKLAIEREEFVVYYQPQIDVSKNKIIGVEALVRWKNPDKGFVLPGTFIALAEETGMMVEIDKLVLDKAISQLHHWSKEGVVTGTVALNVTAKQLEYEGFVEELSAAIADYNIEPDKLVLEISEAHMLKEFEYTMENVKELNALGIHISIDDFGTGCSSLSFLKRLSIHQLKIGQALVSEIPEKKESVEIIKAIIALAGSLNIDMIAEGVETEEEKEFLLALGCEKMQGNYFSEPLNAEELEAFVKTYL